MTQITPFDVPSSQHRLVYRMRKTTRMATKVGEMDVAQAARVDRLVEYCRLNGIVDQDGRVTADLLGAMPNLKGGYTYWAGVLSKKGRSFAAGKAREVELSLGMPRLHLEGGAAWPFDSIDIDKVRKLSAKKLTLLEGAILSAAAAVGLDVRSGEEEPRTGTNDP